MEKTIWIIYYEMYRLGMLMFLESLFNTLKAKRLFVCTKLTELMPFMTYKSMYKKCLIWLLSFYQGCSYILEERKAPIPHKSEVPLQTPHRLSLSHERWIWLFVMVMFRGVGYWIIMQNECVCVHPSQAATLDKSCSESQFPLGTDTVCNHCSRGAGGHCAAWSHSSIPHSQHSTPPPASFIL